MEIALYYAPNTCALAPYVTLTEAGADFEVRPLNFRKRQNFSPEYLKINPKHKVQALACLVCQRHPPLSEPDQQPAQSLRRNGRVRQRDQVRHGSSVRELPDRRR